MRVHVHGIDHAVILVRGGYSPAMLADGSLAVGAGEAHGVELIFG